MNKIYIKIEGMVCNHCYETVTQIIKKDFNVKKVKVKRNIATIWYENDINTEKIIKEMNSKGYTTKNEYISKDKSKIDNNINIVEFILIASIIILIALIINKVFGFNIFNMIPTIQSDIEFGMLFITGLLTSIHCVSMCGAINLAASKDTENNTIKRFQKPVLYNLGRLVSYTVLGGIIGGIGSLFSINYYIQSVIILIAAICMICMSLSMLGIITISSRIKSCKVFRKVKTKNSFIIGILNGLMPCGPLQAMQVYALSTGSIFYGALSMFLFCLGTIPLMLFFGSFINFAKGKTRVVINKIASVLILILSLALLNRALIGFGINIGNKFSERSETQYIQAEMQENYQYVKFDLNYDSFQDVIVKRGIPVKMIINVDKKYLTGCNNEIVINEFGVDQKLQVGENEIDFLQTEEGEFLYSCWMNMIYNKIKVIN